MLPDASFGSASREAKRRKPVGVPQGVLVSWPMFSLMVVLQYVGPSFALRIIGTTVTSAFVGCGPCSSAVCVVPLTFLLVQPVTVCPLVQQRVL